MKNEGNRNLRSSRFENSRRPFLNPDLQDDGHKVSHNVTHDKDIEKVLFETKERSRQIIDSVNSAVAIYEPNDNGTDFIIRDFNQAAEKATKVSRNEIQDRLVTKVFPGVKTSGLLKVFQRVWHTGIAEYCPAFLYQDSRIAFWTANYIFKIDSGEVVAIFEDVTDKKQLENDLRYNAELLECISDAVISMDKQAIIKSWNRRAEAIYGWRREEVIGGKYSDVTNTIFHEGVKFKEIVDEAIKKGFWKGELTQKTKNGEELFIISNITPVKDISGSIVGIVTVNWNITEQKKTELDLLESETRYRAFFENSIDANLITSPDGGIYAANSEACRIFGMTEQELCQLSRTAVMDNSDPRLAAALEERIRTGRFKGELNFKRKDGTIFPGEISSSIFHDSKNNIRTSMNIRDISDRKIMEQHLKESDDRFQSFMNNSPAIAWMKDEDGRYVYLSKTYEKKFGVKFKDWQGKNDYQVWPKNIADQFVKHDKKVIKEAKVIKVVEKTAAKKSKIGYMLTFKFPFYESSGRKYVGGIGIDITDRKNAEEALRQSQNQLRKFSNYLQKQLESEKKYLAAEIHDELGQRLTALKIDLSWLTKKLPLELSSLSQKTRDMINMIDDTDKVVKRISSNLRPPILDDLGLFEALKWLVSQFRDRTGIKCSLLIPEKDFFNGKWAIDVFRVVQESLTNIARHSRATRVNIYVRIQSNRLEVTIRDNGRGITGSEANSGKSYGLMGMQERIFMLSGTLKIEGIKDKGTTVKLCVPIEEQG